MRVVNSQGAVRQAALLYDANGNAILFGQGTMANSLPVAIASNQSTLTVDTELGAAAAAADGASNPTAPWVLAALHEWNGTTWDRLTGLAAGTALTSATRTATTSSGTVPVKTARGIIVSLSVSAASGTGGLALRLLCFDAAGQASYLNAAATNVTVADNYLHYFYPGAVSSATIGSQVKQVIPISIYGSLRFDVYHADASNYTYSVSYTLLP